MTKSRVPAEHGFSTATAVAQGLSLAMAILVASAAFGQTQTPPPSQAPAPPPRSLFGGAATRPDRGRALDLSLSFLGGYDDNVGADLTGVGGAIGNAAFQRNTALGGGQASLTYHAGRDANWIRVGLRTGFRYYLQASDINSADYAATVGVSRRLGRRWLTTANLEVSYLPFFVPRPIGVFVPDVGGTLPGSATDFGVSKQSSLASGGSADLTYDIASRTHVYGSVRFYGLGFSGTETVTQRQRSASTGFNRDLTRRTSLGARYSYDDCESVYLGPSFRSQSKTASLTLTYRRPLLGRRTITFGVEPGFSTIDYTSMVGVRLDRRPSLAGRARIDIGRNWAASVDYQRGVVLVPGIARPYYADTAQGSLTGTLSRRVDATVSLGYSNGAPGSVSNAYTTVNGTAQVRAAISRVSALTVNYIRHRYYFTAAAAVSDTLAPRMNRDGVRVGLDIWLPLKR